jgi:hypothetical protein
VRPGRQQKLTEADMLEARLEQASILKKVRAIPVASPLSSREVHTALTLLSTQVVDAIKDLVQDCNFDCNDSGIALQAMDNSHVALVSMMLKAEGFSPFRCDRNIALGVNLTSLTKVLRAAQNEDILTLKAEDAPDVLNLVFESSETDRISEYDLKLMDIDQEHLGIPDTDYAATITMPASEFKRITTDLIAMSESGMWEPSLSSAGKRSLTQTAQLLSTQTRTVSSSRARATLATALSPCGHIPTWKSPPSPSRSSSASPSR